MAESWFSRNPVSFTTRNTANIWRTTANSQGQLHKEFGSHDHLEILSSAVVNKPFI